MPAVLGNLRTLTRLAVSRTGLIGKWLPGLINGAMQYLHFDDTGLRAQASDECQEWLDGMQDKNGPTCTS